METTDQTNIGPTADIQEQLSTLFGSFKAEWLRDDIFELFTEPSYFPELVTSRSCILIGGRGTGKTTALRGLSYQGQDALATRSGLHAPVRHFIGLYHRVNTNHVTAFDGPELDRHGWSRLFAHYVNLLLVDMVLEFVEWATLRSDVNLTLPSTVWAEVAASLHIQSPRSHREMRDAIAHSRNSFEAYINNVRDAQRPMLSMQAAPLDLLTSRLLSLDALAGKQFFFLIDEYENLLDYQQQVFNTLVKHAANSYAFKIGVRELGWRCRTTLNANEQLVHPADYARIHISEKLEGETFSAFALDVCQRRLAKLTPAHTKPVTDVRSILPGLTDEQEGILLGVEAISNTVLSQLRHHCNSEERDALDRMSPLELYFLEYWSQSEAVPLKQTLNAAMQDATKWRERFDNYKHVLLFTIKKGKRGPRKYYAGWDVFTQLADGNIRYLLELVVQSLLEHIHGGARLGDSVDPLLQTKAAQRVGGKYVSELEGLSIQGAQLTKLLLALGRIFGRMAAEPQGHTPEVNQFRLADNGHQSGDVSVTTRVDGILNAAVMHLALIRFSGNKLGDVGDTKDYTYMMHPIYAPFFEFTHRRKRHMQLTRSQLLELIDSPKQAIRSILSAQNRMEEPTLPDQLLLFETFYHGGT